jgi:hypothetical protein
VILSANWLEQVVSLEAFQFERLSLFRPSTEDLVLTKMMRVDPQDREDIQYLLQQDDFDLELFQQAWRSARCPEVAEIQEAFKKNGEWLRGLLSH